MNATALAEEFRRLSLAAPTFAVVRYVESDGVHDTLAPEADPRRRDQFERLVNLAAPLLGLDAANPLPAFVALLFARTPHGRFARGLDGPKGDATRWSDHADGETRLVDAFGAAAAMLATLDAPPEATAAAEKPAPLAWLPAAMLAVRDYPEWSDRKIAEHVGTSPTTLSRSPEYQAAALAARDQRTPRRGLVNRDRDARHSVDGVA